MSDILNKPNIILYDLLNENPCQKCNGKGITYTNLCNHYLMSEEIRCTECEGVGIENLDVNKALTELATRLIEAEEEIEKLKDLVIPVK
jgi:DnaJ-class molecular chaperone